VTLRQIRSSARPRTRRLLADASGRLGIAVRVAALKTVAEPTGLLHADPLVIRRYDVHEFIESMLFREALGVHQALRRSAKVFDKRNPSGSPLSITRCLILVGGDARPGRILPLAAKRAGQQDMLPFSRRQGLGMQCPSARRIIRSLYKYSNVLADEPDHPPA
jgi:hypothetical protein